MELLSLGELMSIQGSAGLSIGRLPRVRRRPAMAKCEVELVMHQHLLRRAFRNPALIDD